MPCDILENVWGLLAQRLQHEPHHYGATFDIVGAGAVNTVAFLLPVEIVPRLFLRGKDCVQVRDQGDAARRFTPAGQREVRAEFWIGGRNEFGAESQRGKAISGELCKAIYAGAIQGETIDTHHLAQEFEGRREVIVEEVLEVGKIRHWKSF